MTRINQLLKACLRPVCRGLLGPVRPVLRRVREYFASPILHDQRQLLGLVEALRALGSPSLQQLAAEVREQMQELRAIVQDTDRMLLALLQPPPRPPAPAEFQAAALG